VHNFCDRNNIPNTYWLINGAGHDWNVWKQSLWNYSQMICAKGFTNNDGTVTPEDPNPASTQIEGEDYDTQSGIQSENCSEGGQNIGYIENGDYAVYKNVDFGTGVTDFKARVASDTSGGNIEIRLDSATGPLVGTCSVSGTGGWQNWVDANCSVSGVNGTHDLYLKFTGGSGYLFNINWFKFN
jgi:hypothetical protein